MTNRKLQAEIDRVFKKVSEGIETFDSIFHKLETTENLNQKEKYEQDLKKEIKKLQRLREQIKTWISANDIKDKSPLIEQRKLIEQKMELFKACEKEMKTKAFSKEGLTQAARVDPKEKEKKETASWITRNVEELSTQIDKFEAEAETIKANAKRKKSASQLERIDCIDQAVSRHKWHMGRLELTLRLLENGNVSVEQVQNIREDVEYYVENNQDSDFMEDDTIYESLDLEKEEDAFGVVEDIQSGLGSLIEDHQVLQKEENTQREDSRSETGSQRRASENDTNVTRPPLSKSMSVTTVPQKSSDSKSMRLASKDFKEAVSGVNAKTGTTTGAVVSSPPFPASGPSSAPSTPASLSASVPLRKSTTQQLYSVTASLNNTPSKSTLTKTAAEVVAGNASPTHKPVVSTDAIEQTSLPPQTSLASVPAIAAKEPPPPPQPPQPALPTSPEPVSSHATESIPTAEKVTTPAPVLREKPLAALSDLITDFEAAKTAAHAREDLSQYQQMLDSGYAFLPGSLDAERPKQYVPKNPHPTAVYYPQSPAAIFDNVAIFDKLSSDTLFFIFYYRQGTYQQYLAARALKKKAWRYHKKYQTWFQRHEEPTAITDEYEMGTYIYFDYEGAWCQRKKTDFRFEYRYLEDAELG